MKKANTTRRLCIVLLVLFAAVLAACFFVNAAAAKGQTQLEQDPVIMYPSNVQLSSYDFMLSSYQSRCDQGDKPILVFGSSELYSGTTGSMHPAQFFQRSQCSNNLMMMGAANHESLWEAIELGAIAPNLQDKRIVLFPSMQWFYGDTPAKKHEAARNFSSEFSPDAWQALQENNSLSDETKSQLSQSANFYGVSAPDKNNSSSVQDTIKDALNSIDSNAIQVQTNIRAKLSALSSSVSTSNYYGSDPSAVPVKDATQAGTLSSKDWEDLKKQAEIDAQNASDENSFSGENTYQGWSAGRIRLQQYSQVANFSEEEFHNFELLLKVCKENDIEPLIILQPCKGWLYDETALDRGVRQNFYERISSLCAQYNFEIADFTDHDYDRYFLRDQTHPSSLGASYYSEAIYNFLENK